MKFIRFILRGLLTWSLLLFALGAAFAASPRAAEDIAGLLVFALFAGGLLSLLVRRPVPASGSEQPVQTHADSPPPVVETAAPQIPGSRGARMALDHQAPVTSSPDALAVCFRGEIRAYVTRDTWHPVGVLAELDARDPDYRLVALMSVYAQAVLLDGGVYTEQDAIAYALGELVPHELLEHDLPDPSHTAAALCLPADVLTPHNLLALRVALAERDAAQPSGRGWQPTE